MAQVKRTPRYRSPPALHMPSLPNPIRFQPPSLDNTRKIYPLPPNKQFDPVSGLMIDINNSEQSLVSFASSSNPGANRDRQQLVDESVILRHLNDDDDGLLEKKHLPVYARFPFDVSRLPQPMEINVEDNIHKLRLRLINSELKHQRRSTDEYIKRTHRIVMDNDLPNSSDIARELETRRIQEALSKTRRTNQQMIVPNYSYDPRLHLEPVNEENIYTTSNMDDLIDSIARRHLAYRRLDAAIERQRRKHGHHGQYNEWLNTGRTSVRNDDLIYTNRSSRNHTERDRNGFNRMLRSRIDYYNHIQPDVDSMGNDDSVPVNSYTKLPPISLEHNSHLNQKSFLNRSEPFIDLPSDIFITSQTKSINSQQRTRKTRPRSVSKDTRSGTDRSDGENEVPLATSSRYKKSTHNDDSFFTESNNHQKKKPKYNRNLFQKAAIGILFLMTLKQRAIKNRSHRKKQSSSTTIHKIRLQEIIVALHRVYLEPDGPIYSALTQAITNPIPLQNALNSSSKNYSEAIKVIGNAVKNVISKIVEFMPKDGILGTGKISAVSALIQDGNRFPENYFWHCERERLEFDNSKIVDITKQRAIFLLIGIFIFRALVTTLLIKPIKYRLILGELSQTQSINLKILASVILYIGRRAAVPKTQILALPHEWQLSLYNDADIQTILQHWEIKSIINTYEQSLRMWGEEYVRRIDESFDKELRI